MGDLYRLDNRDTPCAVGLIRAAEAMKALAPGTSMELLTKDRFAPMEVTLWTERDGYHLSKVERGGMWPFRHYRFIIEKTPGSANGSSGGNSPRRQ